MKNRKVFHLAAENTNRQYKVSRKIANKMGIVHKPRWRQYGATRRYRKFMYAYFGPIEMVATERGGD